MGSYTAALFLPAAVNKDEIVRNSGKKRFSARRTNQPLFGRAGMKALNYMLVNAS